MIEFTFDLSDLDKLKLDGFFVGWPNPPSEETFKRILRNSQYALLAVENNQLIGFINALSDGVLSAYIPLLEVLPSHHQGKGIGKELVKRLIDELKSIYMIDLSCDDTVVPFYEKLGLRKNNSMFIRNYAFQSGKR
ncbi:MAG: GNAT family N-acetyltransferase [Bdellovibrionales bacterium]|nr:GNAT family N-acetyltransferase [Bdellovibrionales bacterium]